MGKYRNMVIVVAFVEFIAAGLIAGAGARAGDIGCVGAGGKVEQSAGARAAASPYMVCSDMPAACSP
jgi:hypothetical protein